MEINFWFIFKYLFIQVRGACRACLHFFSRAFLLAFFLSCAFSRCFSLKFLLQEFFLFIVHPLPPSAPSLSLTEI